MIKVAFVFYFCRFHRVWERSTTVTIPSPPRADFKDRFPNSAGRLSTVGKIHFPRSLPRGTEFFIPVDRYRITLLRPFILHSTVPCFSSLIKVECILSLLLGLLPTPRHLASLHTHTRSMLPFITTRMQQQQQQRPKTPTMAAHDVSSRPRILFVLLRSIMPRQPSSSSLSLSFFALILLIVCSDWGNAFQQKSHFISQSATLCFRRPPNSKFLAPQKGRAVANVVAARQHRCHPKEQSQEERAAAGAPPTTTNRLPSLVARRLAFSGTWMRLVWGRLENTLTIPHALPNDHDVETTVDTMTTGLYPVLSAGLFGSGSVKRAVSLVKQAHNPITYFVLGILSGFKWDWCFKSPLYWFAIGFTIKWYRARYVFKIPVWDRQPNWNNIITSKEQEKDLKAFTCKKCGSTIFIAKTREFFFEGNTGIGGLGCFSCGAKGAENFVMDRERILEDVADLDDYFEYERPLDFVSRAERRKVLQEAQGDEAKANELLLARSTTTAPITPETTTTTEKEIIDATIVTESSTDPDDPDLEDTDDDPSFVEKNVFDESNNAIESLNKESQPRLDDPAEAATTPPPVVESIEPVDALPLDESSDQEIQQIEASKRKQSIAESTDGVQSSNVQSDIASQRKKLISLKTEPSGKSVNLEGLDELDMDAW